MSLDIVLKDGTVETDVEPITGAKVKFSAVRITRQRTGIHANVRITQGVNSLAWTILNVERETDRTRLGNSAHKMLPDVLKQAYPKERLAADLHEFCLALWPIYNSQFTASLREGDPDGEVTWYCPPIVMEGAGTIVFAPGGSGKSHLAQSVAVSIDSGVSNLWNPIRSAPVLYLNLERNQKLMDMRLGRINQALGLSGRRPLVMLDARGKSMDNIYDGAQASIKEYGIEVIVLDSISASGGGDLNENAPANQMMDMLNDLCPTWLAVGHTPESNTNKLFGSVMYMNRADIGVKLTSQTVDETLGIGLEIVKANDTKRGQKAYFAFEFNGTGLAGIQKASAEDFPELAMKSSLWESIRSVLSEKPSTVTELVDELGIPAKTITSELRSSGSFIRSGNVWALQERTTRAPS